MRMMNKKLLVSLGVIIMGIWPLISYGGFFMTKEDAAVTTADVNDDLYIAGNSVAVEHNVQDDVFSAANSVEVTGNVGQDVYAGGNSVRITGEVGDDVFAGGNTVRITGKRVDDIFAVGNVVEIFSGNINGSIYTAGQNITISGQINGGVQAMGETVKIKAGTEIKGDLVTYGPNEPLIEDNVIIGGEKKHVLDEAKTKPGVMAGKSLLLGWLMSILIWVIAALVLWYVWPELIKDTVRYSLQKSGRSLGIGIIWIIGLIPVAILLLLTIVGWPLALISVFGSAALWLTAKAISMIVVGVWVMQKIQKREAPITWQHILIGTVIIKLVQIVPVVGWLIGLVIFALTLGALGISLWERWRTKSIEPVKTVDAATVD